MIIFQMGPHKSASSFTAQLCRAICEANGHEQTLPDNGFIDRPDKLPDCPPYTVIKTHDLPRKAKPLLQQGKAMAFITLRDPLDSIQSLLDHAAKTEGEGKDEFNEIAGKPYAALDLHMLHLSYAMLWLKLPNTFPVYFPDLQTSPKSVIQMLSQKMRLKADADQILENLGPIRRFNKGTSGRGQALLEGPHGNAFRNRLSALYEAPRWLTSDIKQTVVPLETQVAA